MQGDVLAFNYCAIMIILICGTYFIRTSPKGNVRFTLFNNILITGMVAAVTDLIRVNLADAGLGGSEYWRIGNAAYFGCITLLAPLYLIYIIGITDSWHLIRKYKVRNALCFLPVIICAFVIFSSNFTSIIYKYDAYGQAITRWGYVMIIVLAILYMIITALYVRSIVPYIGKKQSAIFNVPILIVVAAIIFQYFNGKYHIISLAVAVSCMLLVLVGRRAEETVDVTTGMHSYRLFAQNMDMKMKSGKKMDLILVNLLNYEHVLRVVGYDETIQMMRGIKSQLTDIMKHYQAKYLCYNNGNGKFAIEVSQRKYSSIHEIAKDLQKAINNCLNNNAADLEIKANVCIVNSPEDVSDVGALFMLIGDLDKFPNDGNVLSASQITDTQEFILKKEMSTILDRAINNRYFSVYYQPIYNTQEQRFASAEALIRLKDPKYGFISPGVFIPIAEKSGAIHNIGSFVIEEVCKFIASPEFEELGVDYIEINLSVMQCLRSDLADEIISAAEKYQIDPGKLNLEITETASSYSQEKLLNNIKVLNRAGFKFSLDDFGTGYSNLMRITSMPLSIVKLDRTFVLLEEKGGFHKIISNLIKMLKEMGMKVLVEGVETLEMKNTFIEMGVDEIQGFYFSKPLTKEDYVEFLKTHLM